MRFRIPLLLSTLLLLAGSCSSYEDRAREAEAAGDPNAAADLFLEAAKASSCPDRGRLLMRRAEVLELDGQVRSAARSIERAVELCPDAPEPRWARAQRAWDGGDRDLAYADVTLLKDQIPEAADLYREISMQLEVERQVRDRAQERVEALKSLLDPEAPNEDLDGDGSVSFSRQVPYPMTLRYQTQQSVRGDVSFDLKWEEVWSYRGDPADPQHVLVRTLELPPLERDLPLPVRLKMSNQRLPMRFRLDERSNVIEANWLSRGPDRGMRPEMLRPEVEGMLKRRRLFDPGQAGTRAIGETWKGEDVRVVDGKPITVPYESKAVGRVRVQGVPTVHIVTKLLADAYSGTEETWLHPETAVPVKLSRDVRYVIRSDVGDQRWRERTEQLLSKISGSE